MDDRGKAKSYLEMWNKILWPANNFTQEVKSLLTGASK
jgi:hypothetical protein